MHTIIMKINIQSEFTPTTGEGRGNKLSNGSEWKKIR